MEIQILPLRHLSQAEADRIITGYTSNERYAAARLESEAQTTLSLTLEDLPQPYHKKFDTGSETLAMYNQVLEQGFSLGAYRQEYLVALAVAEPRRWNRSLWVWEFDVDPAYRRQGLGMTLMDALSGKAKAAGLRIMVCETQNTNLPAIRFYRKAGFQIEAVDLSYYTNQDVESFEVAIFMKRRLE